MTGPPIELEPAKPKPVGPAQQPKSRMGDAKNALNTIRTAAKRIQFQIAQDKLVEDAYDRMPPVDPAELDKSGEGWRTNVDFGDTESAINEKVELLNNLAGLPLPLIDFETRRNKVHPTTTDVLNMVALEYDFLLNATQMWTVERQKMVHNMTATGLGILYHPEPYSWHFESVPRCNLIYPVKAGLDPDKWPWMAVRKSIDIIALIKKLAEPVNSELLGWDTAKIKKLILTLDKWGAYPGGNKPSIDTDPESFVTGLMENDIAFATENGSYIAGFSHYVREFDDTISEHIIVDNEEIGYIYSSKHRYKSMNEFIYLFPLSLGQGFLEKVRGYGHRILPENALINDIKGRAVDLTVLSGGLMLKGSKEDGLQDVTQLMLGGLVTLIPQEFQLDQRAFSNPAQGLLALEQGLRGHREANNRVFGGADGKSNQETATGAKIEYAKDTRANGFETDRFYVQLTMFHRGVWTRLEYFASKGNKSVPCAGREAALDFWKELRANGAKATDLAAIRSVKANSLFGDGDPAQVFLALQDLGPLLPSLPVTAQRQAFKMMIAARTRKPYLAEAWLPSQTTSDRDKSHQVWRAATEHNSFETGGPMPIQDDDITSIHCIEHTTWAEGVVQNFNDGVLKPDESLKRLILVRDHIVGHMELLSRSKPDEALYADLGMRWKNILNMMRRMQQMVQDAQEAERQRQLQELRNPTLTVEQQQKILTGQAQRAAIAQETEHRMSETSKTEAQRRELMAKEALTKGALAVIESVPLLEEPNTNETKPRSANTQ